MEIGNVAKDSPKEGIININVESMKRRNISENFKVKIIRIIKEC